MSKGLKAQPGVGALYAIAQADTALATAGLPEQNIFRTELREALAAVAELIEADRAYDRARDAAKLCRRGATVRYDKARARRVAAIARVGGAK